MSRLRPTASTAPERGAAATEFALIAPILVVMFFGIVYVGLAVFNRQVIESATREGARVASVGGDADDVRAAVAAAASGFDPATELFYDTIDLCTGIGDDAIIVVRAEGDRLDFDIPFLGSYDPVYTATATFRCEKGAG